MDAYLKSRVDAMSGDFETVTGHPFNEFFCPILLRDEAASLCRGHIVPECLGVSSLWIPQRADVDNFFGSAAEREMNDGIRAKGASMFDVFCDRELSQSIRPRIEFEGVRIPHFFPTPKDVESFRQPDVDGGRRITLRIPPSRAKELEGKPIRLILEKDFRPSIAAAVWKSAHLSMFYLLGYRYVLSAAGQYTAGVLGDFFAMGQTLKGDELRERLATYFSRFARIVRPLDGSGEVCGTITDNRVLAVFSRARTVFAIGVFVNCGKDRFVAFLPGEPSDFDTYLSFLSDPPPSIATKVVEFQSATAEQAERWVTAPGEPVRFALPPD